MTTIVLNAETAKRPIGDVLRSMGDTEVVLRDESGRLVGRILLEPPVQEGEIVFGSMHPPASRDGDVTTQQLLEHLRRLGPE